MGIDRITIKKADFERYVLLKGLHKESDKVIDALIALQFYLDNQIELTEESLKKQIKPLEEEDPDYRGDGANDPENLAKAKHTRLEELEGFFDFMVLGLVKHASFDNDVLTLNLNEFMSVKSLMEENTKKQNKSTEVLELDTADKKLDLDDLHDVLGNFARIYNSKEEEARQKDPRAFKVIRMKKMEKVEDTNGKYDKLKYRKGRRRRKSYRRNTRV